MAEKKSQTLVRAEADEITAWREAATIRGLSLNQYMVDAANRGLVASGLDGFRAATISTVADSAGAVYDSVMLAYDLALNSTPTLTGQRRWVDPQALREVFGGLLSEKPE